MPRRPLPQLFFVLALTLATAFACGFGCTKLKDYDEPPPSTKKEKGAVDKPGAAGGAGSHAHAGKPQAKPKPKDNGKEGPKAKPVPKPKPKPSDAKEAAKLKDNEKDKDKETVKPPVVAKEKEKEKAPEKTKAELAAEKAAAAKTAAAKAEADKAKAKVAAEEAAKVRQQELVARGKTVYESKCTTCHDSDPHDAGTLGPDVWGSSWELLEAKVIRGRYPKGYTPKRGSRAMLPIPEVKDDLSALTAYLNAP